MEPYGDRTSWGFFLGKILIPKTTCNRYFNQMNHI